MKLFDALTVELEWFKTKVWLYHLIKLLTGGTVAFALINAGVPVAIAAAVAFAGTVVLPHAYSAVKGTYPFNVKDTVFDTVVASGSGWTLLIQPYGWLVALGGLAALVGLYIVLLGARWNSP